MKQVTWIDKASRRTEVLLPDDAPDSNAHMGVVIGPPNLGTLKLTKETEIRLHNGLHSRGILTLAQAKAKRVEVFAALQAAFRVDTDTIVALYMNGAEA